MSSLERLGEAGWLPDVRSEESCLTELGVKPARNLGVVHLHVIVGVCGVATHDISAGRGGRALSRGAGVELLRISPSTVLATPTACGTVSRAVMFNRDGPSVRQSHMAPRCRRAVGGPLAKRSLSSATSDGGPSGGSP